MTFSSPIPSGVTTVHVKRGQTAAIGVPSDGTVTAAKMATTTATAGQVFRADGSGGGTYGDQEIASVLGKGYGVAKAALSIVGGAVAVDLNAAQAFDLAVDQAFTLSDPSEPAGSVGGHWYIDAAADASGSYAITLGAQYALQAAHSLNIPASTTTRIWIVQRNAVLFDVYLEDLAA